MKKNSDNNQNQKALVLLSGGLDSATVLAMAMSQGYQCHAMSFRYGQRHSSELDAAVAMAKASHVHHHAIVDIDLRPFGGSALTDHNLKVPVDTHESGDIPITYVPARNTIFLSIALGYAEIHELDAIFIGVNAVDYSGYPDCRPEYIQAFSDMAQLATKRGVQGSPITIKTPLIDLTKAQIIQAGHALGVDYSTTVSCYQADKQGRACGHCDSCYLRKQGFDQASVPDCTHYKE